MRLGCGEDETHLLKHRHPPEAFGGVFQRVGHVLLDGLAPDEVLDLALSLYIEWIVVKLRYLPLSLEVGLIPPFVGLHHELAETRWIVYRSSEFGLCLIKKLNAVKKRAAVNARLVVVA